MRYLHCADIYIDTHNQLLYRQGETINLAPKVFDLLMFLCQNSHRVISKDELMEQVWVGTLVTENAISRTLVKVRKALADDPKNPQFIITVPRKGYRMVADFVAADTVNNQPEGKPSIDRTDELNHRGKAETLVNEKQQYIDPTEPSAIKKSSLTKSTLLIALVVIILLAITYVFSFKSTKVLQTKQVKPLSREVGVEQYPAVSPDLTQLAYRKDVAGKPSYINIENLTSHVKQSISHARGALSKPVWSPTQDKLAFLYQHNSVCTISWAELSNIKDKESWQDITECGAQANPHFVFSPDGQYLYFNDRQSASHGYQIFRVNLVNNEKEIVNQPITNGLGNYSFDISPDGKKLLMINSEFSPTTRIYTLTIESSTLEKTAQLDYLMRSVLWHHDNETIIHPSPHPAYQLWQSDLAGNKLGVVAGNTSRVKHLARVNNGKDFSFISYLLNKDIHFQPKGQASIELDNSTVMDYLPALANNTNQYAFVSKRSTSAEVYLSTIMDGKHPIAETTKQLTDFNNPVKLYDLVFSPNDSQLMILADNQVYIANISDMSVKKLLLDNIAIVGGSWQDENNVLFSTIKNGDWTSMIYNIAEKKLNRMPVGYQGGLYSSVDNRFYLIADDSLQVMTFSDLSAEPLSTGLVCQPSIINRKLNLKATPDGLVCQTNAENQQYGYYSFIEQRSQIWQKPFVGHDFSFNKNGIIYAKMKRSVADIMQTSSFQ